MSRAVPALVCEQEGCPFAEDGRCLEGFAEGDGCPHLHEVAADIEDVSESSDADQSHDDLDTDSDGAEQGDRPSSRPMVELGGDESLSLRTADAVAAKWGARVILIAGEHDAGKSTLLAELYGKFLRGPFNGWSFSGSECLMALERRYHGARGRGPGAPSIDHTVDEDMRLIDWRMKALSGQFISLLLSDIKGEFVRQMIDGQPVADELPLAARADRVVAVFDGEKVADVFDRAEAASSMRLLIGALTEPGGMQPGRPLLILLSKRDLVDEAGLRWFEAEAEKLRVFAESRGTQPSVLSSAARPRERPHDPEGLEDLLDWITDPGAGFQDPIPTRFRSATERSFWAAREGATS